MAQSSHENLGISYSNVPNVQELASKLVVGSSEVPDRYIRPELEGDEVVMSDECVELPIIDHGKLVHPEFSTNECAKLDHACREWGFFQLINHGVSDESIAKMKTSIEEFFKLSLEQRMEIAQRPDGLGGYGQYFITSDEQKLEWADMIYLITHPVEKRDLTLWPTQPHIFRDALSKYSLETKKVASTLLKAMEKNLGLESDVLLDKFKEQNQSVRITYYPPCPKADKVFGISPHSDGAGLTLLLHVNDVKGLQIKKDARWVAVKPLPGAFTANIGDSLEIITNGKYKSLEHRAMVNSEKERLSMATFLSPDTDGIVEPLSDLLKGNKAIYRSVNFVEFMKAYFASKLDKENFLESMKLRDGAEKKKESD